MAIQTRTLADFGQASVSMRFNDANGSISNVSWTVLSGRLVGTISKSGQQDIPIDQTTSGQVNPPAGYDLVLNARGGWSFSGDIQYNLTWHE